MEMRASLAPSTVDRGALILLFLGYISCAMFGLSLGVALPYIMAEFSINAAQAGWLYSALLWSVAILLTPSGYFADHFGRKSVLLWGYLLLTMSVTATAFSRNYWECLAALIAAGAGLGLLVPPYYAIVGEALRRTRGFAVGLAAGIYNLGGSVGSFLLGIFASQQEWRFAYYVMAVFMLLMMVALHVRLKPSPVRAGRNSGSKAHSSLMSTMKQRNILISAFSILIASSSFYGAAAWLPTFLLSFERVDAAAVGAIFGSFMLIGLVASPTLGAVSDRIGRRWVVCISGIASAAISVPMLMTRYWFWLSVAYSLILGFLLVPAWNLLITMGQESVREEFTSSVTGLIQTFGLVGAAVGPIIAGTLIPALGINQALLCSITLPAAIYGILVLTAVETHHK